MFSFSRFATNVKIVSSYFENTTSQVAKAKFEDKYRSFPFTLSINNWKIILSEQEKVKILLHFVMYVRKKKKHRKST